jgi:hypothetical protein
MARALPKEIVDEIIKYTDDLVIIKPLIEEEDEEEKYIPELNPLDISLEFNFHPAELSVSCETWRKTVDDKKTICFGMKPKPGRRDSEVIPIDYLDKFLEAFTNKTKFRLMFPFTNIHNVSGWIQIETNKGKTFILYTHDQYEAKYGINIHIYIPDTEHFINSFKHQLIQLWTNIEKKYTSS